MTLKAWMQEMDIDTSYDEISDENLDTLVWQYRQENPSGGCAYIIGRLCSVHSLRVQRHCVVASLTRVDCYNFNNQPKLIITSQSVLVFKIESFV